MSSQSDLEKRLLELTKENERLVEENALLKFELKELKDRVYGRRPKKDPPSPTAPVVPPKKKGAIFGHLGWFRKNPDKIDKIVEVRLEECPLCQGRNLKECAGIKTHSGTSQIKRRPFVTLINHAEAKSPKQFLVRLTKAL